MSDAAFTRSPTAFCQFRTVTDPNRAVPRAFPPVDPSIRTLIFPAPYGRIKILKKKDLLTPGVYVLLPAPAGYTMAVSAQSLPGEIAVRRINTRIPDACD